MKLTLMLMGGSALLLIGILGIYFGAGATTMNIQEIAALNNIPVAQQRIWFPLVFVGFGVLGALFPFKLFFLGEEPLFPRDLSEAEQAERARGCAASLHELFAELKEYRAFELLRTNRHRTEFVLAQEARVVAMTCTHAALMRQQLAASGLKVDTVIVEEAGQILELETLIPLLLQVGVMEAGKA